MNRIAYPNALYTLSFYTNNMYINILLAYINNLNVLSLFWAF